MNTHKEHLQNSFDPVDYGIENYNQQYVDNLFNTLLFEDKNHWNKLFTQAMKEATTEQKKMVQYALVKAGYDISYRGMRAKEGVDGDPWAKTRAALRQHLSDILDKRDATDVALDRVHQRQALIANTAEQLGNETQVEIYLWHKKEKRQKQFSNFAYSTHLEPKIHTIYNQYEQRHEFTANYGKPFNHINISDVQALTYYESKFVPQAKSTTGSTWLMQITRIAIEDFLADPAKYDLHFVNKELAPYGYSIKKILQSSKKRREALRNPYVNTIIGLAYLNACEQRGIFPAALRAIKAHKNDLMRWVKDKLKNEWITADTKTLTSLYADVLDNEVTQTKFWAYVRYNGEEDTTYGDIEDRYVYALSVLYMGKYCF